jgi:hypothetical protein
MKGDLDVGLMIIGGLAMMAIGVLVVILWALWRERHK